MKNLNELVNKIYEHLLCVDSKSDIILQLETELTEYSKDLLIEFANHIDNRVIYKSDMEKFVVEFLNEKLLNQKAFDERIMKFIEDKDVKNISVSFNTFKRVGQKLQTSLNLKDNEIKIEY